MYTLELKALIEKRTRLRNVIAEATTSLLDVDEQIGNLWEKRLASLANLQERLLAEQAEINNGVSHSIINKRTVTSSHDGLRNAGRKDIEPCVNQILSNQHQPLQTRDLYQQVVKCLKIKGCKIGGQRPIANLSAHLSHIDSVVNIQGFGWVLATNPNTMHFANAVNPNNVLLNYSAELEADMFDDTVACDHPSPSIQNAEWGGAFQELGLND